MHQVGSPMKAVCTMLLLIALVACSHLETRTPVGVDLSGTWELDARRSDSPPPLGRRSRSELDDSNGVSGDDGPPRFSGPMPLLPMVTATSMTIAQDATSMGVDYPNQPYRDVKWGKQKRGLYVVEAGWDDKQRLIIETTSKPLDVRETYSIDASRDTLTLQIDLNGQRMEGRHVTRVFNRKPTERAQ
jgi:hypothetical protein